MKDLLLSEWRRFRRVTLIITLAHVLALVFLSRITHLLQRGFDDHTLMLVVYMLFGLTLALVQVGSYRKPSQWLWLIHRPLPPRQIFAALALSALLMLGIAIFLPLTVFVLATDLFSTQVVDSRHYIGLVHVLAFTMMAWLAGAHASVSRSRATVVVLVAPLLLALHLASVWTLLIPVFACLAWLAVIALHGFRADRSAPIRNPGVLLLTALPLQLAFFVLLFQLSKVGVDVVDMLSYSAPARTVLANDPNIDIEQLQRTGAQQFLAKGLEGSTDSRATAWRDQLPLLEVTEILPDLERFPVRHQVSNLGTLRWDETRGTEWTFSHDQMRYLGRDPKSGAVRGWWGKSGIEAPEEFDAIPIGSVSRSTVFAIDDENQRQHELVRLPAGEWLVANPTRALDRLLLLTNQSLRSYAPDRRTNSAFAPPLLEWQLELPASDARPVAVTIAELLDGWLVSTFHYAGAEFSGFADLIPHTQQVFYIDSAGVATSVGTREVRGHTITLGGAPLVPLASWFMSPPLYALLRWPGSVIDSGLTRPTVLGLVPKVGFFYPLALGLMLVSLLLGAWWLRGSRSDVQKPLWLAMCGLLGLPAFLSLVCLQPRARVEG